MSPNHASVELPELVHCPIHCSTHPQPPCRFPVNIALLLLAVGADAAYSNDDCTKAVGNGAGETQRPLNSLLHFHFAAVHGSDRCLTHTQQTFFHTQQPQMSFIANASARTIITPITQATQNGAELAVPSCPKVDPIFAIALAFRAQARRAYLKRASEAVASAHFTLTPPILTAQRQPLLLLPRLQLQSQWR